MEPFESKLTKSTKLSKEMKHFQLYVGNFAII